MPGLTGYGVFTIYNLPKHFPLMFYGSVIVSKKEAKRLHSLTQGYHTHIKGIGLNDTEDNHCLIGHCTHELPLFYYLYHHLLGSFINSNYNTDLEVNVKEVVLE